jgi:ADP-ribose pyrophosphatase
MLDAGFLRVDKTRLEYRRPDGEWSSPQDRLNVDRGDSVAAILHEPATQTLHFVKQFRFSTYRLEDEPHPENGWLLELIAGAVEPQETIREAMRREVVEETGFKQILACDLIGSFYLTPGASSERLYLFYVAVGVEGRVRGQIAPDGITYRGADDEQIETVEMSVDAFLDKVARMEIADAKTVAAAEYIRRNRQTFSG